MKAFYVLLFALTPPPCFAQHVRFSYDNNGNRIHREWVAERIGEGTAPQTVQLQFTPETSDEETFDVVINNNQLLSIQLNNNDIYKINSSLV